MPTLSQKSRELLRNHPWKGNVRELRNVIERAMILCKSDQITSRHLLLQENTRTIDPSNMEKLSGMLLESGGVRLEELEKSLIEQAMSRAGGNVSRAARMLGLSRPTLRYRLDKYDIAPAGPA